MHELSLVQSIFSSLEEELSKDELDKLKAVELKIGLLANVEPILLQNAFKAFCETKPEYGRVELLTQSIPIKVHCPDCDEDSLVENYVFKCAQCGKPSNKVVSGEELLIHQIHF
jgi:hydrogenase nickel incorporation protein HypA/HybF